MNLTKPFIFFLTVLCAGMTSWGVLFCFETEATTDKYAFYSKLKTADLVKKMDSSDLESRTAALIELVQRSDLDEVMPVLLGQWSSDTELLRAISKQRLKELGSRVVPYLAKYSESNETSDFFLLCEALRTIGPNGSEYVDQLAKRLEEDDRRIQMAALLGLSGMGEKNVPHLDKIRKCLKAKDMNVRLWACRTLIGMKEKAAPAATELLELYENGVSSDKGLATMALAAIGPSEDYDLMELLRKQLSTFTQHEKVRACDGVAMLGKKAMPLKDEVWELVSNPKKRCVPAAAVAYYRMTGEAEKGVEATVKILDDLSNRDVAAERLAQFGPAAASAVPVIIEKLGSEDEVFREALVLALREIGPAAEEALPKLRALAKSDPDRVIRFEAKRTVEAISNPKRDE